MKAAADSFFSFAETNSIATGLIGSMTGFASSAGALFAATNVALGFLAGLFGAATAVFTFLIVFRAWRNRKVPPLRGVGPYGPESVLTAGHML